ncbi:glyoxalase [Frankia sp. CNm7]|uniref:Glyoxalase n=1 Tax=Frankia nepalensis TaxID=1836974 RepID=A0A937R967_9ACTN|nr:glyoxalase [Frankia nepalensis]MBL7495476.1 glyoxalase [Frankia nepalensis]MBL7510183.1 glyoxalase [Frankia nepalensis]MBL7518559.1 glyoxalase [Frankia nepalensis]MBL7626032.1 glyoxalase [Frankia nepalensis]
MPRFHHANLGVPPGLDEAEGAFLIDVLRYRKLDPPPGLVGIARWYQADDGSEIHLSIDPEHRPAAHAHTAIEVDEGIEARLDAAGIAYRSGGFGDLVVTFCDDPAGNRWELRRPQGA